MRTQAELRPVLLRRMKEDVENLPDKEEVVVWVELTTEQRHFYKAIYGKQVLVCLTALQQGACLAAWQILMWDAKPTKCPRASLASEHVMSG